LAIGVADPVARYQLYATDMSCPEDRERRSGVDKPDVGRREGKTDVGITGKNSLGGQS